MQDDDGQVNFETVRAVTGSTFMMRIPFRNKAEVPLDVSYSLLCPPIVSKCPGELNPNSTICPDACPLGATPDELGEFDRFCATSVTEDVTVTVTGTVHRDWD
jgi:hypothetical protein